MMEVHWPTLVLQTINFAVLAWLLQRFLYKPVLRMIDNRKADIERQYENVKTVELKVNARLAEIEAERAKLAADREAAFKSIAAEAQEAAKARRAEAEREAAALVAETRKKLAAERDELLAEAQKSALLISP